jgi:hypothetical protein
MRKNEPSIPCRVDVLVLRGSMNDFLIWLLIVCLGVCCLSLQYQIIRLDVLTGNDKWIDTAHPMWLRRFCKWCREHA